MLEVKGFVFSRGSTISEFKSAVFKSLLGKTERTEVYFYQAENSKFGSLESQICDL